MPGGILPGAKTPHFAPGNPFFPPPGAKPVLFAPDRVDLGMSVTKMTKNGADRGLKSEVGAEISQNRHLDSLRQPVGRMCESLRTLACAVGGCARAVRRERLPRVLEAEKPVGLQADKLFFAWMAAAPQALPEAPG